MFIKKSFVDEIANSMERQLVDGVINKQAEKEERLVKAANYLNAAAEIFDESGLNVHAELITAVLESLAAKKSKKSKKKDKPKAKSKAAPKTKAPSSEKMVKNLKEKGWVFDENGADDTNYVDDNCALCGDMSYNKDYLAANDLADPLDDQELMSMLDDFKAHDDAGFEDEDLHDPDTFSEEAYHPDAKMRDFQLEDPEYSGDFDEPRDSVNTHHWNKSPIINYHDD